MAMAAAPQRRSYIRLQALRALLLGFSRAQVCTLCARSDRMVRLGVERFNRGGIEAVRPKPPGQRPRQVKLERVRDLLVPVLENPAQAGGGPLDRRQRAWRPQGTTLRRARLAHHDPLAARAELSPALSSALARTPAGAGTTGLSRTSARLDESSHGQVVVQRRWVQPGKPRPVPYLGDPIRQNSIGAVSPQTGEWFRRIADGVDTDVFQFFLDHLAETVPKVEEARQLLVLDHASWHKATRLNWHPFEPVYPPGYSPDFNPMERLWLRLKADGFWVFSAQTHTALTDRLGTALKSFIDQLAKTTALGSIRQ